MTHYADEHEDSDLARKSTTSPEGQENYERHLNDLAERRKQAFINEGLRSFPKLLEYPSIGGRLVVGLTIGTPDGNSGESVIRIDGTDAGNFWFEDTVKRPESPRAVTLRIAGEDEHRVLAKALREIADHLDNA